MTLKASPFMGAFFLFVMMSLHSVQSYHSFEFIEQLKGCQKGQSVDGLHKLKQYLKKFGYLSNDHYTKAYNGEDVHETDDKFDLLLESAVKAFQLNYHLNVTGTLDSYTANQMMKPRCGIADVVNDTAPNSIPSGQTIHRVSHYKFFTENLKWPPTKSHLTYKLKSSVKVPGDPPINLSSICSRAFKQWAEVSHFTFEEVSGNDAADIVIGFHRGYHGDSQPFDGPDGVVAHASPPFGGALHYDADERWSPTSLPGPNEMDLESVAVHEIGHILGLDHSFVPEAVMFPYIDSGFTKRKLHSDDVQGIRTLYGLK